MGRRNRAYRAISKLKRQATICEKCEAYITRFVIIENNTGTEKKRVCLSCLDKILNMPGVQVIDSNVGKDQ